MVYKDLEPIKTALDHNDEILNDIILTLSDDHPRTVNFVNKIKDSVGTHVRSLKQISKSINEKISEIYADTKRYKRGLINGVGSIWKAITGNLDASDGEYYVNCINKINQDERHLETLMKNQISVTTSIIKSFNSTIQQLKIDEETFNKDIIQIEKAMQDVSNEMWKLEIKLKLIELCESLLESYTFIKDTLNDVLDSITFARLKILHNSIITPQDLVSSLQRISQSLNKNNLPLSASSSQVARYLDIIELQAFQIESKIVFVLKIPLVEPETYTLYRLYPIPILDNRTGLHHVLATNQKYIAKEDDSLSFVSIQDIKNCKTLMPNIKLCMNILSYPIDSDAICEAQILKNVNILPRTCQTKLIFAKDYNVQNLGRNEWLISISDPLPITIKCPNKEIKSVILNVNSILKLQPSCSAFIGSTRVRAEPIVYYGANITYTYQPISIPYECCKHLPDKHSLPKLKPLRLSNINADDLNIAKHKLDQYSEELDKLMNEPFVAKHISWFIYATITAIVIGITMYIVYKCKRRRGNRKIGIINSSDQSPPQPPKYRIAKTLRRLLPKRRPSVNLRDTSEEESIELNMNSKSYTH